MKFNVFKFKTKYFQNNLIGCVISHAEFKFKFQECGILL